MLFAMNGLEYVTALSCANLSNPSKRRVGIVLGIEKEATRHNLKPGGHKSHTMLMRYIRDANLFREHAAAKVGL